MYRNVIPTTFKMIDGEFDSFIPNATYTYALHQEWKRTIRDKIRCFVWDMYLHVNSHLNYKTFIDHIDHYEYECDVAICYDYAKDSLNEWIDLHPNEGEFNDETS